MIRNYLKIALRNLKRNKAYASVNVVGLSLGLVCGILIFTLITYHLGFDNFHHNSNRIYRIYTEWDDETVGKTPGVAQPLGKTFRNNYSLGEKTARIISFYDNLITFNSGSELKKFEEKDGVAFAEPEFFDIFNFPLLKGDKKTVLSKPNQAIITEKLAKKYFGSASEAMSKVIRLDNKVSFTIAGILKDLPPNTDRTQEIYLPYSSMEQYTGDTHRENNWGGVYSGSEAYTLLRPGVALPQVNSALAQIVKTHFKGRDLQVVHYKLQPLADIHFNTDLNGYADKKYLWALFFIGLFLIITACVNFVNLATAQALNRAKEVGVRKVLGGLPKQLFWQFIAETTLITLVALGLAIGLAELALPMINNLFQSKMQFDWPILSLFLVAITVVVVFLAGSYPGLVLARFQPIEALKSKLSQEQAGGFTLRRVLVVLQFSISQALIIGAIIVVSQLHYSKNTDMGFNRNAVVMLPLPQNDVAKLGTLRNRIDGIPGVEKSSFCLSAPASEMNNTTDVRFDTRTEAEHWGINTKDADADYLSTFGIKLVAGRNFYPSDTTREFLVNETFVHKLNLQPRDVIGKTLTINGKHVHAPIVGVVKDFYNQSFHSEISPLCIMANHNQYQAIGVKLNIHNAGTALPAIEKIWNDTFPNDLYSYKFMDDKIAEFYEIDNILLTLVEAFAGIAVFIGCLGLYGLVSFMAVRKTKEIGVRKVLGASIQQILWLFGKEFARLLLIAFVIAAPLAWWAMHSYLQDFKYQIPIGPAIFLTSIAATFFIATITVGYRATVSALTNPVKSLRSE